MKRILLLTTSDRPREYTADLKVWLEADLEDTQVNIMNLDDLQFFSVNGKVEIVHRDVALDQFDFVYMKHWHAFEEQALVVAHYFKKLNVTTVPNEVLSIVPKTKFGETFLMALNELPVPDSFYMEHELPAEEYYDILVNSVGLPFVYKSTGGKKGANNYLVSTKEEFVQIKQSPEGSPYISQSFIDNEGDYRIINFGDELKLAIYRTRSGDTHLNNTSLGGDGTLVELDDLPRQVTADSLKAAQILGRDISGIDVVVGKDGKHYLFEVNYSPQLTTGTFLDIKRKEVSKFFRNMLQG